MRAAFTLMIVSVNLIKLTNLIGFVEMVYLATCMIIKLAKQHDMDSLFLLIVLIQDALEK